MITTPTDALFSRTQFLSGGPLDNRQLCYFAVYPRGRSTTELYSGVRLNALYHFNKFVVNQVTYQDVEKTAFLQSSNGANKVYAFNRAVMALTIQAAVADGSPRDIAVADPQTVHHQEYLELLWLYENELKISAATAKGRTVVFGMNDMQYTGALVGMTDGWAADMDQLVPVNLEFLVFRADRIGLPTKSPTAAASMETLSVEAIAEQATVNKKVLSLKGQPK